MRDKLHLHFQEMAQVVDHCLERDLITPALILIYSSMDAAAWLWSDQGQRDVRRSFEAWVDEFLAELDGDKPGDAH